MIDLLLALLLGFIASYLFLNLYLKKTSQEKYRFIRFKAKNSILEDETLFFEKTERIAYLKDTINEVSQKTSAIRGKNISDKHLYKDEIIENYEMKQRLKNKENAEDSEKADDDTSSDGMNKEDKIILGSDFPSHIM